MEILLPYMFNRQQESNLDDEREGDETQQSDLRDNLNIEDDNMEIELFNNENLGNEDVAENRNTANEKKTENDGTPESKPKNKSAKKDDISSLLRQSTERRETRAEERAIERKRLEEAAVVETKPRDDQLSHFLSMYEITKKMSFK